MKLIDVNQWVYAFRQDSPFHEKARESINSCLQRREPFLFSPGIASSFIRLVTNPKIFKEPSTIEEAWNFVDALESHPARVWIEPDPMSFGIFKHLCLIANASGNGIPDAWLAALAIRNDAVFVTSNRKFSRYKGLRLEIIE